MSLNTRNLAKGIIILSMILMLVPSAYAQKKNVIDQVVWMVGDEPILLSDIMKQKQYYDSNGQALNGDPMCIIPEQIAIQKLFLNQAKTDSIKPNTTFIAQQVNMWIEQLINKLGGRKKVEEYFGQSISQLREEQMKRQTEQNIVQLEQEKITKDIKVSPSEVTKFYNKTNKDSLPYMPTKVEVQIITMAPKILNKQVDEIKKKLRDYSDQVTSGKMDFSILARLYSQDPTTAIRGGEMGFVGKAELEPEFANVAFGLNNNKKVSRIVKTARGYNIMQLIEKRGDKINVRNILLKPEPSAKEIEKTIAKLDSVAILIKKDSVTFAEAARYISTDEDTSNSNGQMVNNNPQSPLYGTSMFEFSDLPQQIAKQIGNMKVGEISVPFEMKDKNNNLVIAIVRLKRKVQGHRANMTEDYQELKDILLTRKRNKEILNWIKDKQKTTYVKISPDFKHCKFMYPGWIKE